MDTVALDGVDVTYEAVGAGQPVVLLHANAFVDWYAPLVERLTDWSVLRYRRRVGADRLAAGAPFGLAEDAALFERLVGHLGIGRPHVVGHSYGGLLALEVARRGRLDLRSLALLEPAPSGFLRPAQVAGTVSALQDLARTDGTDAAMHRFLTAVIGPHGAAQLENAVPGAVDTACAHGRQFLDVELPAVGDWEFDADDAARLALPTLLLAGTSSDARFVATVDELREWIDGAQRVDIAGATHLMMADHPGPIADALATFWHRH